MKPLMTVVDKGSTWTAIVRGLAGPKGKACAFKVEISLWLLKGKKAKIPLLFKGFVVTQQNSDASASIGRCTLHLLTPDDLRIELFVDEVWRGNNIALRAISNSPAMAFENPGNVTPFAAVPKTASGLLGEQPLVDRITRTREVGKLDLYLWKKDWLWGLCTRTSH